MPLMAQDISGFWKSLDDKTHLPDSIIAIYPYEGKYYGRIIATYNEKGQLEDTIELPKNRAPSIKGHPFYSGLDIIWGLEREGSKYVNGKILDPEKGNIYNAQMWPENGNLIVRGQLWVFGENRTWVPASNQDFPQGFKKPDLAQLIPQIPQVEKHYSTSHTHSHQTTAQKTVSQN